MARPRLVALRRPARAGAALAIGLVNNMPDAALKTTERQFAELLARAAGAAPYTLRVFSFPELPRAPEGRRYVAAHHEPIARLWDSALDGLIVTGAAPAAARIEDEPCWPTLTRLVDWAERHTASTIWSCLAAHAAVRCLDGIARRPLGAKLSGLYACRRAGDHRLVARAPARWTTPHSRYNTLPETALAAAGYRILSRAPEAGADIFVKRGRSLFVFLQGHPEYDAGALGREYRRDVAQFLAGNSATYPELPENYFPAGVAAALLAFRDSALNDRDAARLDAFPALPAMPAPWHNAATALYAAWLDQLRPQRQSAISWPGLSPPAAAGAEASTHLSPDAAAAK